MQIAASSGVCGKCGQSMVQVEGNTQCIFCSPAYSAGSGLVVSVNDPGEEELNKLLAKSGVALPKAADVSKASAPKPQVISKVQDVPYQTTPVAQNITFADEIKRAIDLLQSLPMPKDIKQFKAVNKAVKTLEAILEVK